MGYEIEVEEIQPRATVGIRFTTTRPELGAQMEPALNEVWRYLERQGVKVAGPPFARYYDATPEHLDLEVGFPVSSPQAGEDRIISGGLSGGTVAVTWHHGTYEALGEAHEALAAWIAQRGYAQAGAPWEVYWTDPNAILDPDVWKTEVIWPIARVP